MCERESRSSASVSARTSTTFLRLFQLLLRFPRECRSPALFPRSCPASALAEPPRHPLTDRTPQMEDQNLVAKRIVGTNALVDGFRFQSPEFPTYFLTHAHSDHTTGLLEREGSLYQRRRERERERERAKERRHCFFPPFPVDHLGRKTLAQLLSLSPPLKKKKKNRPHPRLLRRYHLLLPRHRRSHHPRHPSC